MKDRLDEREDVVFRSPGGTCLDLEDICFLARDVWLAKSARAPKTNVANEKGLSRFLDTLHFTRQATLPFY